ncbi:MAG: carbon-nitrogen hydrolase family protein [Clostridium sp.]|uniref:carbon-nitrogen hydrolase family protein n=1 Tax=Clostridium sp. DSM 8431 TaxID=1761781 RepID=UPI0008EF2ED6|nr:carbon-nitrogen hydrolase family protein [Clostridium sp. DSM 8431]MCR4943388.1 carbon-nitrogen hydrolase family protein [Clostridium sp.]SFU37471.1 Predicted amidohydrolase [Clostridium sp. DSM 8431]
MNSNINVYPKSTLRIALAQVKSEDGNITKNIDKAVKIIKNAAKEGAKIVAFPEKFLTGYVPELVETNIEKYTVFKNDSRLEAIHNACRENKIYAIVGTPLKDKDDIFISSIIIDADGKEIDTYNKTHLFYTEKSLFKNDSRLCILNIDDWKIGLGICYDSGFPEHSRALAKAGCQVYLVSALFSKGNGYSESRIWFPARALDNTIYTAMCNYVGKTGVWDTAGSSGVWNPLGKLVKEASKDEEELLIVDLDPSKLKEAREGELMLQDSFDINYSFNELI